jgi:deoxycytidine triphosphate deaminase/guanylate kinase
MIYKGVIVTGTSAAGVLVVARKLCEKYENFRIIPTATTRASKGTADEMPLTLISRGQFDKLDKENGLVTKNQSNGDLYGVTKKAVQQAIDDNRTPVIITSPSSLKELDARSELGKYLFLSVFLDSADDVIDTRLEKSEMRTDNMKTWAADRGQSITCTYTINNTNEDQTAELIWALWEYRNVGGVLPRRMIQLMIECGTLLTNANIANATAAAYDLVLDDEYFHNGKIKTLSATESFITMEPGDYAIVGSKEIANIPKDIVGRFGLSVNLFFQGIILSNGPQIDPGFNGRLYCLLFNSSSQEIQLKRSQHYATIEFIKLLEPTIPYSGDHQYKNNISEYLPRNIPSSAIRDLRKDVKALKAERWWIKILPLVISLFAIFIAILKLVLG